MKFYFNSCRSRFFRYCIIIGIATKCVLASGFADTTEASADILLIVGAPGESKYKEAFVQTADIWRKLSEDANANLKVVGLEPDSSNDKKQITDWITEQASESALPVWIVYIGHGTSNTIETKLNLRGADLSLPELKPMLDSLNRPLVFIHGGSSSGPFLTELSGPQRIIITATKSGQEQNYARFGEMFTKALASPNGDLDQDGQISILEAFVSASETVETYYLEAGRLTTEHALLDDNGDGKGQPAQNFPGLRTRGPANDGYRARNVALVQLESHVHLSPELLDKRDELEARLGELIQQKAKLSELEYYERLETLLREIGSLYFVEDGES